MSTGFYHLDGPADAPWRPARARHVLHATLIVAALMLADIAAAELTYAWGLYYRPSETNLTDGGFAMLVFYAQIALIYLGFIWWRDARPLPAYGLTAAGWRDALPWWLFGFAIGAPGIIQAFVEVGHAEHLRFALWAVLLGAPFFVLPAAFEEIFFRGWLMQTVAARHGGMIALWGGAIIFAAWHLDLSGSSLNAFLSVIFRLPAGLALGLLVLRTRNLWAAIGAHAGWNAADHGAVAVLAREEGLWPWDSSFMVGADTRLSDLVDPYFLFDVAHILAPLGVILWLARGEYGQLVRDGRRL